MNKIRDQVIPAKNYYEKGWRVYSKELCIFTIRFVICKSQFYMFTFNDPCILSMPLFDGPDRDSNPESVVRCSTK